MIAHLDLGLFVLDPNAWKKDRARLLAPIAAMANHGKWMRRYPMRLLWSDDFFEGFPWNQLPCPTELRDACIVLTSLYEYLKSHSRLLNPGDLPPPPEGEPLLDPDLAAKGSYPDALRALWISLLVSAVTSPDLAAAGLGVATWERTGAEPRSRDLRVSLEKSPRSLLGAVALLIGDEDWDVFVRKYHKPDLSGLRVAVLGGNRAPFERARAQLETYGIKECRRLPPAYEENRSKQDTKQRLSNTDLLIICTNRLLHTDTDQIKSIESELPCALVRLNNDTEAQIVQAVIDHFRDRT
jgi:hypothetical protein